MSRQYDVPFGNLSGINDGIMPQVAEVISSGQLIGGHYVEEFEAEFGEYLGVPHCSTTASGMDALIIALLACNLEPDSKVGVLNIAGGYASLAVLSAGLTPIFLDVHANDFLLDVEGAINSAEKLDAIVVTHLYGVSAISRQLIDWAHTNDVLIIEDCAQAAGLTHEGQSVGTFGDIGCFSFYPTKNLGGIGDGGAIVTKSADIARRIGYLRNYGWTSRYDISVPRGRNSRLDAINAVALSLKLKNLDHMNSKRRDIFRKYLAADPDRHLFPLSIRAENSVVHLAVGHARSPEEFKRFALRFGVQIERHYPVPDSEQSGLNFKSAKSNLPNSKAWCDSVVTIPLYPHLTSLQIDKVVEMILEWAKISGRNIESA